MRKLISFGKGSFIISMPKSWIEKNKLKKGDLISIEDSGHELVVSASQDEIKAEGREISIEAKDKPVEYVRAEVVSAYLNCYDTISIHFEQDSKEITKMKDIIRNLSGLEIMEQTSTRIVAKNLININEISISNIIRRMDIITRAMIEDAVLCYRSQCTYESIYHRDVDMNRLYFLGSRVIKNAIKNPRIAKSLNIEAWHLHSHSLIILNIEKIADRQKRISRYLCNASLDRNTLAELDRIHTDISESFNNVMKAFYNSDRQIATNIEVTNKERAAACDRVLKKFTESRNCREKNFSANLVAIAKIIENLKAMAAEIRVIARTVLCFE